MRTKAAVIEEMLDEVWERYFWIDPMNKLLDGWTAEEAGRSLHKGIPSVTQIVNHTAFWEEVAARRIAGLSYDDLTQRFDDAHDGLAPSDMPHWPGAAENYRKQRAAIVSALKKLSDTDLAKPIPGENFTLLWSVVGRAIHDVYHAGQLSYLHQLKGHETRPKNDMIAPATTVKLDEKAELKKFLLELMDNAWAGRMWLHPVEPLLPEVSSQLSNWRPDSNVPTFAEIIYHMKFWKEYVTRPLRGQSNEDMPRAEQANGPGRKLAHMPSWPQLQKETVDQHRAFREAVAALKEPDLFTALAIGHPAYDFPYRLVCGVILHDSYHLGQLVLLQQMFQAA
ncbi:DinB family protein [Candidatus Acetothermia bacterium]|nr:DinB family protein [Candidatus Acetothermia bacterium]